MKKWLQSFTFVIIPNSTQSVRRFNMPRIVLFAAPILLIILLVSFLLLLLIITNQTKYTNQLETELAAFTSTHQTQLASKDEQIATMKSELLSLSEQAYEIEGKLQEINNLEHELKQFINSSNISTSIDDGMSSSASQFESQGGEEIPLERISSTALAANAWQKYEQAMQLAEKLQPDLEATKTAMHEHQQLMDITPNIWPTDSRKITSSFGTRKDPLSRRSTYHSGVDIGANRGDSIYATASGTVTVSEKAYPYGNYIEIDHGESFRTRYLHLSKRVAEVGDKVNKGDLIGEAGSTGRSTGPHLHYEVIVDGQTVNPELYMLEEGELNHVQK